MTKKWVSCSSIHNYLLKDPILDFIKYSKKIDTKISTKIDTKIDTSLVKEPTLLGKRKREGPKVQEESQGPKVQEESAILPETSFYKYILEKGISFENEIIELIKKKIPSDQFVQICSNRFHIRSQKYYKKTIDEMKKGTYVIYQGALHDSKKKYFGSPDMIIRSDIIQNIISDDVLIEFNNDKSKVPYTYCIIDIKFKTLPLTSDGIHLLNEGRTVCNKGQIFLYNNLLTLIQGTHSRYCYTLGRTYNYRQGPNSFKGTGPFDKLGHIDTMEKDYHYKKLTDDALDWLHRLNENIDTWTLYPRPSVPELYPNMSNTNDMPYHNFKVNYANVIKELTLLWNVGPENRKKAHEKGIVTYDDIRLTASTLGISGKVIPVVLDSMISLYHSNDLISPKVLSEKTKKKLEKGPYECFIDFETVNNVFIDNNIIYCIGLYHENIYKCFLAEELTIESSVKIFNEFKEYIRSFPSDSIFYHWGAIEPDLYSKMPGIFNSRNEKLPSIIFQDLLSIIKTEPILCKGIFNFNLKNVSGFLVDNKLITNEGYHISGGLESMIAANNLYNKPFDRDLFKDIIAYNKTDCLSVFKILEFIRNFYKIRNFID